MLPKVFRSHPLSSLFVVAFAFRLLHVAQMQGTAFADLRFGDGSSYHAWAQRIAGGDWLGSEAFYQAPLYPYFLGVVYALFGDSTLTVRLVQALVGAGSCVLLGMAGRSLLGAAGVLAGWLLALYPPAVFQEALMEKTALITLCTCGMLALALREGVGCWRRWAGAGALLGLLGLLRENALLLVVPLAVWGWTRGSRRAVLALAGGCLAVLLPVGLRNQAVSGEFHLTTSQFGPNLYIGNHAGASGMYEPLVAGHANALHEREDATRIAEGMSQRRLTPGEVSSFWTQQALAFVGAQPGEWARLIAKKLGMTFHAAEISDTESLLVYQEWSWPLRLPFGFGLVLALGAVGVVLTAREYRKFWLLYAGVGVYALSTALFYVLARYRFPLVPLLLLMGTAGVLRAAALVRRGDRRTLVPALVAGVGALVVAHLPIVDTSGDRATGYLAIAASLAAQPERMNESLTFYQRALAEDPQWPPARFGLGVLLTQRGRAQEAIPHLEAALALWPSYGEAHYALALALEAVGRHAEAARERGLALRSGVGPQF